MTDIPTPQGKTKDVILVVAAVATVVVGVVALKQHQAGATAGLTPTGGVGYLSGGGGGSSAGTGTPGLTAADLSTAIKALQQQFGDALTQQQTDEAKAITGLQTNTQSAFDNLTGNINNALKTMVGQESSDAAAAQGNIAALSQTFKDTVTALLGKEQSDVNGLANATNAALATQTTQTQGWFDALKTQLAGMFGTVNNNISTLGDKVTDLSGQVNDQGKSISGLTSGLGSVNDFLGSINRVSIQGTDVLTTATSGGSWNHGFSTGTGFKS